jgi:hypothetical protein
MRSSKIPFESMCPKCAQVQPQRGFDRNSLLRLLSSGYPVEAYCATCNEFWPINAKERTALVAAATRESRLTANSVGASAARMLHHKKLRLLNGALTENDIVIHKGR